MQLHFPARPVSETAALEALAETTYSDSYANSTAFDKARENGWGFSGMLHAWNAATDDSPELTAEEANTLFSDMGVKFDGPIKQQTAALIASRKQEETRRNAVLARSNGGVDQVLAGLAGGVLDPGEMALNFVPVTRLASAARVGKWATEAEHAARLAGKGFGARAITRAGEGSLEGAVGGLMSSTLQWGFMSREQKDMEAADWLANVGLGAILGSTLQAGIGRLSDGVDAVSVTGRGLPLRDILTGDEADLMLRTKGLIPDLEKQLGYNPRIVEREIASGTSMGYEDRIAYLTRQADDNYRAVAGPGRMSPILEADHAPGAAVPNPLFPDRSFVANADGKLEWGRLQPDAARTMETDGPVLVQNGWDAEGLGPDFLRETLENPDQVLRTVTNGREKITLTRQIDGNRAGSLELEKSPEGHLTVTSAKTGTPQDGQIVWDARTGAATTPDQPRPTRQQVEAEITRRMLSDISEANPTLKPDEVAAMAKEARDAMPPMATVDDQIAEMQKLMDEIMPDEQDRDGINPLFSEVDQTFKARSDGLKQAAACLLGAL